MPSMEIMNALESLTVKAFAGQSRKAVFLETTSCVKEALKTFNSEKILSCPVSLSHTDNARDVCGFLDLFDLLAYLLNLWDENQITNKDDISKLGEIFLNHKVQDLTDLSDNDVYAAVIAGEQAHRLVRLFGLGVHRVALLDMKGSLTNIISQSDIVKYLNTNLEMLGENRHKSIQDLGMVTRGDDVIVAHADQSALSAFRLLASHMISAVPVIDKEGVIAGTLSLSDLKLLRDDLSPLLLPTSQYKSLQEPHPDIVCTPQTSLASVISMLGNSGVHRVWVVDAQRRPTSVISVTNVCEFLSQFLPEEN